jgi:hypothetical protein
MIYRFVVGASDPHTVATAFAESARDALNAGEIEEARSHLNMVLMFLTRLRSI